jgi:hypothetical protein
MTSFAAGDVIRWRRRVSVVCRADGAVLLVWPVAYRTRERANEIACIDPADRWVLRAAADVVVCAGVLLPMRGAGQERLGAVAPPTLRAIIAAAQREVSTTLTVRRWQADLQHRRDGAVVL